MRFEVRFGRSPRCISARHAELLHLLILVVLERRTRLQGSTADPPAAACQPVLYSLSVLECVWVRFGSVLNLFWDFSRFPVLKVRFVRSKGATLEQFLCFGVPF